MPLLILLAFIAVPMIEIAVFIKVGGLIGLWPTLAIVILTAILGTAALRQQGLSTLRRAQEAMNRNELPVREVFDGLCLLVAGALLLTPGFVTDALGALLFVPQVRTLLRNLIGRHLLRNAEVHVGGFPGEGGRARDGRGDGDDDVIEGDYEEVPEPRERIRRD